MSSDPLEIVAGTADAVVGTDEEGRVVIWNKAAERLLGYGAAEVLGKPCHDVLCGMDPFGNRFCDENCTVKSMVRRHDAVRHFEMSLRTSGERQVSVSVSIVVVPGPRPSQHTILHLLQPVAVVAGSEQLVERIGTRSRRPGGAESAEGAEPAVPLTVREIAVLRLLADGVGTQEIASSLFISVTTVRNHIQNILRKLDVHSKLEAVSLALRRRLI